MNARVDRSVVILPTFVNGDGNTFSIEVAERGTACGMSTEKTTLMWCVCVWPFYKNPY